LNPTGDAARFIWVSQMTQAARAGTDDKTEVWLGTLALMVLTTLEVPGPPHGFGIARRIEQTSGDRLSVNPGTLYPTLLKLEQEAPSRRRGECPRMAAARPNAQNPSVSSADGP
jgi:hypothetical protein